MPGLLASIRSGATVRALGTVSFQPGDASIYLRPVGKPATVYDYGFVVLAAGTAEHQFVTKGQLRAIERPHVSIHDSGRCHVRSGTGGALLEMGEQIGRLRAYRGAHVGTIQSSSTSDLPLVDDVWPDVGARDEDAERWDIAAPLHAATVRIAVFISRNPQRPAAGSFAHREVPRRRADGGTLFVALNAFAESAPLGEPAVVVIGGWKPPEDDGPAPATRLLYVRDSVSR
jgi:hypothetical protein